MNKDLTQQHSAQHGFTDSIWSGITVVGFLTVCPVCPGALSDPCWESLQITTISCRLEFWVMLTYELGNIFHYMYVNIKP